MFINMVMPIIVPMHRGGGGSISLSELGLVTLVVTLIIGLLIQYLWVVLNLFSNDYNTKLELLIDCIPFVFVIEFFIALISKISDLD